MRTRSYHKIDREQIIKTINELAKNEYLGHAVIRAVFTKNNAGNWEYLIGKCELGEASDDSEAFYSDHAFICKSVSHFNLNEFLKSLEERGYLITKNMPPIIKKDKSSINWTEEIIPSHATSSGFPARKYSARINNDAYFNESILLGFDMPFYQSSGEYLRNFMRLRKYYGDSDGRKSYNRIWCLSS